MRPAENGRSGHAHESGRAQAKVPTLKTLRKVIVYAQGQNLLQTLSRSPPRKEIEKGKWEQYLAFILPLLDIRPEAYRKRALRRVRFENFMKRDKSLDDLCTRKQTVLIAFGDGNVPQGLATLLRRCAAFGND